MRLPPPEIDALGREHLLHLLKDICGNNGICLTPYMIAWAVYDTEIKKNLAIMNAETDETIRISKAISAADHKSAEYFELLDQYLDILDASQKTSCRYHEINDYWEKYGRSGGGGEYQPG